MSRERRERRQSVANRAAVRLRCGEDAIDRAIREVGLLCADMPDLRAEAQLSAIVGQDVFAALARSYHAAVEARGHLVEAHSALGRVGDSLSITPSPDVGGLDKPPIHGALVAVLPVAA